MNYERINWENSPSTDTPLDADNLNKMDEGLDTLNREVQKTRTDLAKVEESTDVLAARMSSFTRLPDGSTTGDAEIVDARIGADSTSYDTLGDAIRGQFTSIRNAVFSTTSSGGIGEYVYKGGVLYKRKKNATWPATTPEPPNSEYYDVVILTQDIEAIVNTFAQQFYQGNTYSAGDYVVYGGSLFKFNSDYSGDDWDDADVTMVDIGSELKSKADQNELNTAIGSLNERLGDVDDAVSDAVDELHAILVEDHGEGEQVTLTNQCNISDYRSVAFHRGFVINSLIDGVLILTSNGESELSPYVTANVLTTGTLLIGCKFRFVKLDPSLADPENFRVIVGDGNAQDYPVSAWGTWNDFSEVVTVGETELKRLRFSARNFPTNPTAGQFTLEIKEIYVYNVANVSAEMCAYIQEQQSANYQDGTVTYGETTVTTYEPDTTLAVAGKAADSKATGDAIHALSETIEEDMEGLEGLKDAADLLVQVHSAALDNETELKNFGTQYGLKRDSIATNLAVFSPSTSPDVSPTIRDSCALGSSKWLVGFKYKATKLDPNLGNPEMVRVILGSSETHDFSVIWGEWTNISLISTVDLTRVQFALRNFSAAVTQGQLQLEIKDYYVYDVSGLDTELVRHIADQQANNYEDGEVTYSLSALSDKLALSLGCINAKNYGVSGDGVTDDTDAIRAMFAQNTGNFYFPAGTYIITGTIEVPGNSVLYGDGDDTVIDMHNCETLTTCIFRGGEKVYPYILVRNENVTIRRIKLIGNNSLKQQRHAGVAILDTEKCTVEDLTIYNINFDPDQDNDAVVSGYGICVTRSEYINVERCYVERCGYECIGIVDDCNNCVVRDCYTQDGWRTCIQVHRGSCNTVIENCYMKQTHTKYDACFTVHGLPAQVVKNLRVINCTVECTQNGAQPFDYCAPYQIMSDTECLVFTGNRSSNGKRAFYINSSSANAKIIGNDFHCNEDSDYGITIGSLNSIVIGNYLVNEAETNNVIQNTPLLVGNVGIS